MTSKLVILIYTVRSNTEIRTVILSVIKQTEYIDTTCKVKETDSLL